MGQNLADRGVNREQTHQPTSEARVCSPRIHRCQGAPSSDGIRAGQGWEQQCSSCVDLRRRECVRYSASRTASPLGTLGKSPDIVKHAGLSIPNAHEAPVSPDDTSHHAQRD